MRVDSAMRDHLANERTLLAWIRTSIAFMAFGMGVEKFSIFLHFTALDLANVELQWNPMSARLLAIILIVFGGILAAAGAIRTERWARQAATLEGAPPTWPLISLAIVTCVVSLLLVIHVMLTGL